MTTLKSLVKGKDYPIIEHRVLYEDNCYELSDDLFGFCGYINGELISYDGDSYSLDTICDEYEVWNIEKDWVFGDYKYPAGTQALTIWERVDSF